MRLIKEASNIPEELIDAIEKDNLVVFAGAGVSKPEPSNLPDFKTLAYNIAKNIRFQQCEYEDVDRFLGKIADNFPNNPYYIHDQITEKFKLAIKPNYLHNYILKLFEHKIRIVTTNYDNLFSIAAKENNILLKEYYAPAIPLGDNFEGLVYLHGNIYDKAENLVVTDKDFSQAYICRGWATRFLQKLFEQYTVLFIGYSYNDTILKYLTRGITSDNLYALIPSDNTDNWDNLGIHTIEYDNKDTKHTNLKLLLEKMIENYCNDVSSKTARIEKLSSQPPDALDFFDVEYIKCRILCKDWMCSHFLENITKDNQVEWLIFLLENNYLKSIFIQKANYTLNNIEKYIANWIVARFIEKDEYYYDDYREEKDGIITRILKKYHYNLSEYLAGCLNNKFTNDITNPKIYAVWLEGILKSDLSNQRKSYTLTLQLCTCIKKNYIPQAKLLLHYLLKISYNYNKKEIEHNAENYWLIDLYKKHSNKLFNFYKTILSIVPLELEKINLFYNNAYKPEQISSISIRSIENCGLDIEDDNCKSDLMYLIMMLRDSFDILILNKQFDVAKSYVCQWLNSEIYLLNRMGIYGLYSNKIFDADSILDIFINKNWLWDAINFKHEIRHYFKLNYHLLSNDGKLKLYNSLVNRINSANETHDWIEVMRFLRYIRSNSDNYCNIIEKQFKEVSYHINVPTEHISTDLDSYCYSFGIGGIIDFQCQYTVDSLIKMDLNNAENIKLLLTAKGKEIIDNIEWGESREGVLIKVKEATIKSYKWALILFKKLISNDINSDLFSPVFKGLAEVEFTKENLEEIIRQINLYGDKINYKEINDDNLFAYLYLISKITKVDVNIINNHEEIKLLENNLIKLWHTLPEKDEIDIRNDILNQAINDPFGEIIEYVVNIMHIEYKLNNDNVNVFNQYKKFFENEIFNKNSFKAQMGLSILSRKISYFYFFDPEWTKKNLIEKISHSSLYKIVWNSFVYSNPRFEKNFITDLLSQFNNIIDNYQNYNDIEHKEKFYEFYLLMFLCTLLFYPENLEKFNLNNAIDKFDDNGIDLFYEHLSTRLNDKIILEHWSKVNDWIWDFWETRLNCTNKEEEKSISLELIFSLKKYFPKCIEIIKKVQFAKFNNFILYRFKKEGFIEDYPVETVSFLNHIINDNSIHCIQYGNELKEILEIIISKNTKLDELKSLLEKLINNNFTWAIPMLKTYNAI